jgi:HK97 family phage major capsid protein
MSATQTRAKLTEIESKIRELREKRAGAILTRDRARDAFALVPGYDTNSREFKAAQVTVKAVEDIDAQVADAQQAQVGVLRLLGQDTSKARGDDFNGGDRHAVELLKSEPGRWLASALDRRKDQVQNLPDGVRFKAMSTTANGGTVEESEAVLDLLSPQSVAFASGIRSITIDSTETRIPRFTSTPQAGWRVELGPFVKSDAGLEQVTAKPPMCGLVSTLSIELFADLTPLALSMVQTQMLRAVSLALDKGLLFGSGTAPEPRGLANTVGILTETGVPLTNLAGFASAIGDLLATNARPGALVMNPLDVGVLLGLTEDATSNVPLWKASLTGGPAGLRLPYFDTPLWPTPACPQGTALLYDPATVIAVIRSDVDVAVDPLYSMDTGEIGFRVFVRAVPIVGQPTGTVKITFAP